MKTKGKYARLFSVGNRQAVLLPPGVRFEGKRVSIRECSSGLLIEAGQRPRFREIKAWFAAIDACPVSPDFLRDLRD
jgi:virulence-associated protein VagC